MIPQLSIISVYTQNDRGVDMPSTPSQAPTPPPIVATIHIYRGIMDRATTWRVRVDTTTNWAIITTGTSVSFVLGSASRPHAAMLLTMVFTLAFLVIESRRLRYYDLWSSWVRL